MRACFFCFVLFFFNGGFNWFNRYKMILVLGIITACLWGKYNPCIYHGVRESSNPVRMVTACKHQFCYIFPSNNWLNTIGEDIWSISIKSQSQKVTSLVILRFDVGGISNRRQLELLANAWHLTTQKLHYYSGRRRADILPVASASDGYRPAPGSCTGVSSEPIRDLMKNIKVSLQAIDFSLLYLVH